MKVEIVNKQEVEDALEEAVLRQVAPIIEQVLNEARELIISELPTADSSPIAKDLYVKKISDTEWEIRADNPVWAYLDLGTGIYGPEGREITPIEAKALTFKNTRIALALGFPTEQVFLKKVKGIRPRHYFTRYYNETRLKKEVEKKGLNTTIE